jgi:alginate O-acetyltransferase complex protein AlgI
MLFVDPLFLVFLVIVLSVYWSLRSNTWRKAFLLLVSFVFYGFWDWRFVGLLLFSSGFNFLAGAAIDRTVAPHRRRWWLIAGIAVNLGVLGLFKYLGFFADSARELLRFFGQDMSFAMAHIVLPVGISFFTFHGLSYLIDIYRGKIASNRGPLDFFLYMAFFPQLVAGPIVRAAKFMPQMRRLRSVSMRRFKFLIALFLVGFFKKAIVSDSIAPTIDQVFAAPALFDAHAHLLAVVLYAIQIYCDFSGYTDMAIAVAGMLGYRFPQNFAAPYLATSISDFWRRWHMSLSSWLRDYLYIPLGGNRHGELKTYRNLFLTMGLGGLWHGASWNFLVWGLMHGSALSVERFWHEHVATRYRKPGGSDAGRFSLSNLTATGAKWALTFGLVCAAWVLFRSQSFADAAYMIGSMLGLRSGGSQSVTTAWWAVIAILWAIHYANWRRDLVRRMVFMPAAGVAAVCAVQAAAIVLLQPQVTTPFIYFQF